jgi:hypothetical protein
VAGPDELMEELVHFDWSFFFAAVEPPAEQCEHAAGERCGARGKFASRNVLESTGFDQPAFDAASEMAFGEIVEIFEVTGLGENAVELILIADVREKFGHRRDAFRLVSLIAECVAHGFAEHFELAEEQVVDVALVKVEGGSADAGAVEDILYSDFADGLLEDEIEKCGAELHACAADTGVVFSH